MSSEMILFLHKPHIPESATLQDPVDSLGLPLQSYTALDLVNHSGFSPSSIKGTSPGFEIYSQPAQEVLPYYPQMRGTIGARDWAITIRWGSRISERACALAASVALVKECDAVAYSPENDITYTLKTLLDEFQDCMKSI